MKNNRIRTVDLTTISLENFKKSFIGCVILTKDHQILLQQRSEDCFCFPNFISTFGGEIELGETPEQALVRELHEELGAKVSISDVIFLGAVTEAVTDHIELVYEYFWHDKHGSIQGCYEEAPIYFNDLDSVLRLEDKLMDDVVWVLDTCKNRSLLEK